MDLLLISDTHGEFPATPNKEYDVFIHAGDIFGNSTREWKQDFLYQFSEANRVFIPWLDRINAKHKLLITGNHDADWPGNEWELFCKENGAMSLHDRSVVINGIKFTGSSWSHCPPEFDESRWAYAASEERLGEIYDRYPDDTNVLIAHNPPYGLCDYVPRQYKHIGSKSLRKKLEQNYFSDLKLLVAGHVHEGRGSFSADNWTVVNTANGFTEFTI